MDPSRNPYAPSAASLAGAEVRVGARLWRLEKLLIMARDDGDLPNRCVKCNEAAEEPTKTRTLYWHHPGFYVVLLINIIAYVIVALIARKKAKLSPGLCARHKQKRVLGLWIGWGGFILGFIATSMAFGSDQPGLGLLFLLAMFGCIIAGIIMSRIVYANRIDDRYVRIKGCGEAFLAELPEFRPGARDF
ncbi:MAG TPA: hypothetical protein VJT10_17890 [Steroidobacteraceae bacterium]|nr:hypothetical protein [Steroidobacteraceae bacterium]